MIESKLSFINQDNISCSFLAWTSLICLTLLMSIIVFGFFTNFDITDEGWHLYHHMFGADFVSLRGMHFFTHTIGKIFNHSALGYRFSTLFFLIFFSIYLAHSIKKNIFIKKNLRIQEQIVFYSMICVSSLAFFIYLPSFDYQVFSIYSAVGWAGSFMFYLHEKENKGKYSFLFLFLIAFFIFSATITKFTFGIPLFIISIFLLVAYSYLFKVKTIKDTCWIFLSLLLLFATIYIFHIDYWERFFKLCSFLIKKNNFSHPSNDGGVFSLISAYYHQIFLFVGDRMVPMMVVMAILYVFRNKNIQLKNINIFIEILAVFLAVYLAIEDIPDFNSRHPRYLLSTSAISFLYGLLLCVSIFYLIKFKKHPEIKKILFSCVILMVVLLSPAGTDNHFIHASSRGLIGLGALFMTLLFLTTKNLKLKRTFLLSMMIGITIIIGYSITWNLTLHYHRNESYVEQDSISKYSSFLKGIKIEKGFANAIDNLWLILEKINFDRNRDRIFAYTDLPGFLYSTGVRSFGESWAISGFPKSYQLMCLYFDLESAENVRNIYILKINNKPIHPIVKDCLFKKIKFSSHGVKKYDIGKPGWNHHTKLKMDIQLMGPYSLK